MAITRWAKEAQSLMRNKGLKQADLIDIFEVNTQGGVSHYFQGKYEASEEHLINLAKKLEVPDRHFIDIQSNDVVELHIDHELLTEAFQTIARHNKLSEREITKFFSVYQKMNPAQVAEVYEILKVQKAKTMEGLKHTFRKFGS
ncbi:hypothetical protein JL49_13455 [Pseudoalteromonas luteoviolacea]|nr:hypothetical protein JL49_13455 [Pseudoalteromonas luteoviolacea]